MIDVSEALTNFNDAQPAEKRDGHRKYLDSLLGSCATFMAKGDDPEWSNARFREQSHPFLVMTEPAELAPLREVLDPTDRGIGSFPAGFSMTEWIGNFEVPVSMRTLNEMFMNAQGPMHATGDHRDRLAYIRAVKLVPGLLINLTADFSSTIHGGAARRGEKRKRLETYAPELFLAYQIMSRLVDQKDPGVIRTNGRVDRGYLYQRYALTPVPEQAAS